MLNIVLNKKYIFETWNVLKSMTHKMNVFLNIHLKITIDHCHSISNKSKNKSVVELKMEII